LTKWTSAGVKGTTKLLGVAAEDTKSYAVAILTATNIWLAGKTKGNLGGETLSGREDQFIYQLVAPMAAVDSSAADYRQKVIAITSIVAGALIISAIMYFVMMHLFAATTVTATATATTIATATPTPTQPETELKGHHEKEVDPDLSQVNIGIGENGAEPEPTQV